MSALRLPNYFQCRFTRISSHTIIKTLRHLPKRMRACWQKGFIAKRGSYRGGAAAVAAKKEEVENRNLITCGKAPAIHWGQANRRTERQRDERQGQSEGQVLYELWICAEAQQIFMERLLWIAAGRQKMGWKAAKVMRGWQEGKAWLPAWGSKMGIL